MYSPRVMPRKRQVGIRPVRRVSAYLAHLGALGLVVRRVDLGSKLLFQITDRGLERLEWLRGRDKPSALEELLTPLLRAERAPKGGKAFSENQGAQT